MPWDGKLHHWFRTGEQQRMVCGYNTHESALHDKRQYGGTFAMVSGPACEHVVNTGTDPSGLGRWCWIRFSSKTGRSTMVFVVYRPVRQSREHTLSTYMQQSRYFEQHNDFTCPRRALLRDLEQAITQCLLRGDRMVIAGDFNENTACGHLASLFHSLGFREATFQRFPNRPVPSTMSRGSIPVDASRRPRAAVVDFDMEAFLGEPLVKVFRPHGRRLNTRIPGVAQLYNALLELHCARHHLLPKHSLATTNWTGQWDRFGVRIEQLDRIRLEGMAFAEKRCRRFNTGSVFFSPELDKWSKLRHLYSLTIRYHEPGRRIRRATILRLAAKCQVDNILRLPPLVLTQRFREADRHYRTLKPRSAELRDTFLRNQLAHISPSSSRYQFIRTLIQHEEQRFVSRFLHHLEGVPQRRSVTAVTEELSPGDAPHYSWCTKEEVESALRRCLEQRFCLTNHSPLMQSQLFALLGNGFTTPTGWDILRGHPPVVSPTLASPYTSWLLQGMARPSPPLPLIDTTISALDFQRYWRRAKERTSSSISGMHFGHYKSAASSEALSEIHAFFTEILFRSGYPLSRWQKGLQVIIEKKPGVILVSKLRAILLMEADFNFGNKLFVGHRMLENARRAGQIPVELYGGVKGRRVESMALARCLLADIFRQKRCSGAIASVDAQSCYDRIVHSAASLCCQRWGVPSRIMESMLRSIQGMKFYLRTGYGDSDQFYGGGRTIFQGICQGNGAGPAVWLAISAVLILILRERHSGRPIRGALSAISVFMIAFLFVDDTDLIVVDPPCCRNPLDLVSRLQHLVHSWQGLLLASGGSLSADKCSWSLAAFKWNLGKWSYHTSKTLPATLLICDSNGVAIPIRRVEPNESLTVVGVVQSMDGSMKGQLSSMTVARDKWCNALCSGLIPRHIAWAAINTKIWPSLRFPLSATTFSPQQGCQLMGKLYRHLLPCLGANRNIPIAVRSGPLHMAGLNLPDPYVYQGSQQVAQFYHSFGSLTTEGQLLLISLEQLQLEVGIRLPVLSSSFLKYGFLATPCWLTSLWAFLSSYNIDLEVDGALPNRCRLYLRLIVASDLATGAGDTVRDDIYRLTARCSLGTSKYEWPAEHPSPRDVRNWQKCLTFTFRHTPLNLGHWISDPHCVGDDWWYDPQTDHIYQHKFARWMEYSLSASRHTRLASSLGSRYQLSGIRDWSTRPLSLHRTTVHIFDDGRVSHEGHAPIRLHISDSPTPAVPRTLAAFLASREPRIYDILQGATFPHDGRDVALAIQNGTAHGACDGSYMPSRSTSHSASAWILEDHTRIGHPYCFGTAGTPGWIPQDLNAYRAELHGIYSILLAIQLIVDYHQVESGSISIYCDNEKAVYLTNQLDIPSPTFPHTDLIRCIRDLCRNFPFTVSFFHVKGHQDALCTPSCLARPAQLNVLCDSIAKTALLRQVATQQPFSLLPPGTLLLGESSRVRLGGVKLTGSIQDRISAHCTRQAIQSYLIRKEILSPDMFDKVNWEGIGHYLRRQSLSVRLWASKHSYNFAATGRNMRRWGLGTDDSCPCCGQRNETLLHLYSCPDPRMVESRSSSLTAFSNWMASVDTHPAIASCFSTVLNDQVIPILFSSCCASPLLSAAAEEQDAIGRWNTWVGRLSSSWAHLQELHYRDTGSRRNAVLWASGMVEHLLYVGYACWTTRNNTLHDQTLGSLNIREAALLNGAISDQFAEGLTDLRSQDFHLITKRDLPQLLRLPATHRRLWLQSITVARQQGRSQTQSELHSMASIMQQWLSQSQ